MIVKRIYEKKSICLYKLEYENLIEVKSKEDIDIDIDFIKENSCDDILSWRGKDIANEFKDMIGNKELGIYARYNKEVVGHAWCILGKYNNYPNNMFKIDSNQAMIHFCRVKKSFQGNNIYPYMLVSIIKHIHKENNINIFYIWTVKNNLSSKNGLVKVGFQIDKEYNCYKIMGRVLKKIKL